jgi:Protein of unknown function (DUF2794)
LHPIEKVDVWRRIHPQTRRGSSRSDGRGVAAGDWRDYAMDGLADRALFSIYRRASEAPLYLVEKRPDLARKQGEWTLYSAHGLVLKRGHDLPQLLRFFDRKRFALVD